LLVEFLLNLRTKDFIHLINTNRTKTRIRMRDWTIFVHPDGKKTS
jgi:hypothetical protein